MLVYSQFIFRYFKELRIQDEATFNLKNCHSRNDILDSHHNLVLPVRSLTPAHLPFHQVTKLL